MKIELTLIAYHNKVYEFLGNEWLTSRKDIIHLVICDMIKGNESDVANIDFEL